MTQHATPLAPKHSPSVSRISPLAAKLCTKLMMIVCLLGGIAFGQKDGIASFSVADSHDFDTVNLTTLIPSLNFPVISKPAALPFNVSIEVSTKLLWILFWW